MKPSPGPAFASCVRWIHVLPHSPSDMMNTLYLPELREMLADNNEAELQEFCGALHPARTAEFMEGLSPEEAWRVLQHADSDRRLEIFDFFEDSKKVAIVEHQDRGEIAELIGDMFADDRVDLLKLLPADVADELIQRIPSEERRETLRLTAYPEGTAGAVMTTEVAKVSETLTVRQAFAELARQAEELETIYYVYIVDEQEHLRGLVSTRKLVSAMGKMETQLGQLMESNLIVAYVTEDQELVARKMADYNLLAIPVVGEDYRLLGIITHDDILDVFREEATEDAHRSAGVEPIEEPYMEVSLLKLSWARGVWLILLFFGALLTATALGSFERELQTWGWLVLFLPLIVSTGGNAGNQSATLILTGLSSGKVTIDDWLQIVQRELLVGLLLGVTLAGIGLVAALFAAPSWYDALVLPLTILAIVVSGAVIGAVLPLIFKRMGLDPALMSNPFVAGIIDILGIVLYMSIARLLLSAGS